MNTMIFLAAIYGTLVGGSFVNAPKVVNVDGYWRGADTITENQANALGYKMLVDERPACASNEYAVANGYALDGNRIIRVYNKQVIPVALPRYSVADLVFWAALNGKTDALMAWLKANGYYEVVLTTREFDADNEVFGVVRTSLVNEGIVTNEEVSAALAYALVGGAE